MLTQGIAGKALCKADGLIIVTSNNIFCIVESIVEKALCKADKDIK